MNKEILCIGGTHGDEPFGIVTLKSLEKEYGNTYDWIIGNEMAASQGTRCFEGDLNRSAPGDLNADNYAVRRAAQIIQTAQEYKYVIDIHGTTQDTGIFIILTKMSEENLRLASMLPIKNIVYWPSINSALKGPTSEFYRCGLEIECGAKTNPKIWAELVDILKDFFENYKQRESFDFENVLAQKNIFEVYRGLERNQETEKLTLKEFEEVEYFGEKFRPLLVGTYSEVLCYMMRDFNWKQFLARKS